MSSANLSSAAIGSDPADSTKMRGVVAVESLKEGSMAKGIGSTKRLPMASDTKLVMAGTSYKMGGCGGYGH